MNPYLSGKVFAFISCLGAFLGYVVLWTDILEFRSNNPEFGAAILLCAIAGTVWIILAQLYLLGVFQWFSLLGDTGKQTPNWLATMMSAIPVVAAGTGLVLLVVLLITGTWHPGVILLIGAVVVLSLGAGAVASLVSERIAKTRKEAVTQSEKITVETVAVG